MARVALVTGGMGGLGEAICIKLAALGYKVVTTHSPSNTKAQEWLQTMNNMGYGFKAYPCDVADFDSCKACVEQVTKEVGAVENKGSWWLHWIEWLRGHGGKDVVARGRLGSTKYEPIEPAPGRYVKERA